MDAEGHLLEQAYGNGVVTQQDFDPLTGRIKAIRAGTNAGVQNLAYTYDKRGNLLTRSDTNQSLSESFLYDNLNRIMSNTVNSTGAGLVTQTYAYDTIGNITSRSDAGIYAYGAVNTRPHAVTQITRADGSIRQFIYDNSGNLVQEVERDAANNVMAAKGRTETWTSFNMPVTLANANTSIQFVYGSDHQRIKEINPTSTTYFIHPDNSGGLLYELEVKSNGTWEHRNFITAGAAGAVAIVKRDGYGNETGVVYLHRDNLGSVTAVTDGAGGVVERMAYEPFGRRRTPAGAMDANGTLAGVNTSRGYTNHEELDSLGLVHMNGRVYDPVTGRFISADPHIQAPAVLQSYNRYSYVWNNPLAYTDPTGFLTDTGSTTGCTYNDQGARVCTSSGGSSGQIDPADFAERMGADLVDGIPTDTIVGHRSPPVDLSSSCMSSGSCYISPSAGGNSDDRVVCDQICINQRTLIATPVSSSSGNFAQDSFNNYKSKVTAAGWNAVRYVGLRWVLLSMLGSGVMEEAAGAEVLATKFSYGAKATRYSSTQLKIELTQAQAIENLAANGFTKSMSKDGTVTVMSNGDKIYRFYPNSTGGGVAGAESGVPTASLSVGGEIIAKLRFLIPKS